MIKKIAALPSNIVGVSAEATLTHEDYESTLIPLLAEEHKRGHRIRFLYQFGPAFTGFTPGAAWDDFKVGMKYLRLFERCAIVSDKDWIQNATHLLGSLMPCPTRTFRNEEMADAVAWLASPLVESNLKFELTSDGILILRPHGPLSREDFENLATAADPWIEKHDHLLGMIVYIEKFPGWETVGSFIQHLKFVKSHHRKIRKVALVVDGALPEIASKLASHLVEAEIKHFPYAQFEEAKKWVAP